MIPRCRIHFSSLLIASLALLQPADLRPLNASPAQQKSVTVWTASVQGPFPSGNASAQPNLSLVFDPPSNEARDQSFRLIVRPDLWGRQARFRFSNAFGVHPVTFDGVYAGLQLGGGAIVPGRTGQFYSAANRRSLSRLANHGGAIRSSLLLFAIPPRFNSGDAN